MQLDAPELRKELVQVAAVCVAMIRDMDHGTTDLSTGQHLMDDGDVHADIAKERVRQVEKWGDQSHNPVEWFMILQEEVGEVASDVLLMVDTFFPSTDVIMRSDSPKYLLRTFSNMEGLARKWLFEHFNYREEEHDDS